MLLDNAGMLSFYRYESSKRERARKVGTEVTSGAEFPAKQGGQCAVTQTEMEVSVGRRSAVKKNNRPSDNS